MVLSNVIIDAPYEDRGCYNCWYRMMILNKDYPLCEVHRVPISIWKWCEGWESEERHSIRIKTKH